MKVTITITCDNAAFEGDPGDEVSRILQELSEKITRRGLGDMNNIKDINGNTVGSVKVTDDQGDSQ